MRQDAQKIIDAALAATQPGVGVRRAVTDHQFAPGRIVMVAIGKAAWAMAKSACDTLGDRLDSGVVITKYDHSQGDLPRTQVFEAGHPVADDNTYKATQVALAAVKGLSADDTVLFLVSGGGSALFEAPLLDPSEIADINQQLLASGANIVEINTIRKRLSRVKGGHFAQLCAPAHVLAVVLSDVLGDPLDSIASGPAYPDSATAEHAQEIAARYQLRLSDAATELLKVETPKSLDNVTSLIVGNVAELIGTGERTCRELGYEPIALTDVLTCEARDAGRFLGAIARYHAAGDKSVAFLAGGETVVHITGTGMGGRNQELAFAASPVIAGLRDVAVFSFGSDGTDGPTDAAGGYVDGDSLAKLQAAGWNVPKCLADNDSYHALADIDGLIVTGPTGTNVNDLSVVLIRR